MVRLIGPYEGYVSWWMLNLSAEVRERGVAAREIGVGAGEIETLGTFPGDLTQLVQLTPKGKLVGHGILCHRLEEVLKKVEHNLRRDGTSTTLFPRDMEETVAEVARIEVPRFRGLISAAQASVVPADLTAVEGFVEPRRVVAELLSSERNFANYFDKAFRASHGLGAALLLIGAVSLYWGLSKNDPSTRDNNHSRSLRA